MLSRFRDFKWTFSLFSARLGEISHLPNRFGRERVNQNMDRSADGMKDRDAPLVREPASSACRVAADCHLYRFADLSSAARSYAACSLAHAMEKLTGRCLWMQSTVSRMRPTT